MKLQSEQAVSVSAVILGGFCLFLLRTSTYLTMMDDKAMLTINSINSLRRLKHFIFDVAGLDSEQGLCRSMSSDNTTLPELGALKMF